MNRQSRSIRQDSFVRVFYTVLRGRHAGLSFKLAKRIGSGAANRSFRWGGNRGANSWVEALGRRLAVLAAAYSYLRQSLGLDALYGSLDMTLGSQAEAAVAEVELGSAAGIWQLLPEILPARKPPSEMPTERRQLWCRSLSPAGNSRRTERPQLSHHGQSSDRIPNRTYQPRQS